MSPNPHPTPYSRANHKPDCPCPACRGARGIKKARLYIAIEPDLKQWLKEFAMQTEKSEGEVIELALTQLKNSL